jgi:hypothetical protein
MHRVEQLGPAPSLTQALTLILTQSAKAEHESRRARQQLAHNLKKAVQVVKTNHSDIETMKGSVAMVEGTVGDIKDGQVYLEQKAGQIEYLMNKTYSITCEQGSRKLAPLAPPVPDKPHLVGQNEIKMREKNWAYYGKSKEILPYTDK